MFIMYRYMFGANVLACVLAKTLINQKLTDFPASYSEVYIAVL